MRFERLVIETSAHPFSLTMHPRLTVIAGLVARERVTLAHDLISALGPGRSGVHLEVVEGSGRRLAVFRPEGARHRVVAIDGLVDVTDEFALPGAAIDLLARHHLDQGRARRLLQLSSVELQASVRDDEIARRLSELDQTELWSAAARVRVTDDVLTQEVAALGAGADDAELIEQVETYHHRYEAAVALHLRLRRFATIVGAVAGLAGLAVGIFDPLLSLPLFGIGVVTTLLAIVYRRRAGHAQRSEQEVLDAAGAESYLGFQVQRVDGLLSSTDDRRRLLSAAEDHRQAAARWAATAGDVSVDWAMEHHEQITTEARRRDDRASTRSTSPDAVSPVPANDRGDSEMTAALHRRLTMADQLGHGHEGFPLVLDEPFAGLPDTLKSELFDVLVRSAGAPQAVLLTGDDNISSWARSRTPTDALSVVEAAEIANSFTGGEAAVRAEPAQPRTG